MQFEGVRRSGQAPNLTPLIDIVFLLLVFFMLTAHFVRDEGLPIALPEAVSAVSIEEKEPLKVLIAENGQLSVNGESIELTALEGWLKQQLAMREHKLVVLRGDQSLQLGMMVKVMDAVRQAGAVGLDIVTEQPERR